MLNATITYKQYLHLEFHEDDHEKYLTYVLKQNPQELGPMVTVNRLYVAEKALGKGMSFEITVF